MDGLRSLQSGRGWEWGVEIKSLLTTWNNLNVIYSSDDELVIVYSPKELSLRAAVFWRRGSLNHCRRSPRRAKNALLAMTGSFKIELRSGAVELLAMTP
jgi:hypothetical protein